MTKDFAALVERITPGPVEVVYYDAGDRDYYDHNGPTPSIQSEEQDCAIVHWDGFKQQYWTSANGNQRQIEANAEFIAFCFNNAHQIAEALGERERIVAFIREQQSNADKRLDECSHDKSAQHFAAASVTCQRLANAIEAGIHKGDK